MTKMETFAHQQYLNIETFRKSGAAVRTPVWFALDGGTIFIQTEVNSGKVKRIHNNESVNIAACTVDGTLLGEWVPATAREVDEKDIAKKADQLLNKKYGFMKTIFGLPSVLQGKKYIVLEVIGKESDER